MKTTKQSTFSATLRTTILFASLGGLLVVIGALIGGPQGAGALPVIALLINVGLLLLQRQTGAGREPREADRRSRKRRASTR